MKYFLLVLFLVLPMSMFAAEQTSGDTQQQGSAATVSHSDQAPDGPQLRHSPKDSRPGPRHQESRHNSYGVLPHRMAHSGAWWKNSDLVKELGVSEEQVQKMDKVFQDNRIQLVDAKTALEREEVRLRPMMEAYNPDGQQIAAQIDKVASARAQLEKTNAMMLVEIRRVLTQEQWKKLQSLQSRPRPHKIVVPHDEGRFGKEKD